MKVMMLNTGRIEDHNPEFAVRLVEQGRAVLPPAGKAKPAADKAEEKPARKTGKD